MAQHDQIIDNGSGPAVRGDVNDAFAAVFSNSSGATAPSTTVAYQWWADTANGLLKQRNAANTAWVTRGDLATAFLQSSDIGLAAGNVLQIDQSEAETSSAATVVLSTAQRHQITGTTSITSFSGVAGVTYNCRASAAFALTHHATNLNILQTGANITTAAGDTFDVYMRTTTTCEIRNYQRSSGEALVSSGGAIRSAKTSATGTAVDFTSIPGGTTKIKVLISGVSTNGSSNWTMQIGDSEGIETSGYVASAEKITAAGSLSTSGFVFNNSVDSSLTHTGVLVLELLEESTNTWICSGLIMRYSTTTANCVSSGYKSLSGELDRIRIVMENGTDQFDAGDFVIVYE